MTEDELRRREQEAMRESDSEKRDRARRAADAARVAAIPAIAQAADKFLGFVASHARDLEVAELTANTALDFAAKRRRDRKAL